MDSRRRRPQPNHRSGVCCIDGYRIGRTHTRFENHLTCSSDGQKAFGGNLAEEGTSGGRNRRRNQRCSGIESRTRGSLDGRRHKRSQGSQRHHHHGQFIHKHHTSRDVGTLALPQHTAIYPLPDDHQRGSLSDCVDWRICRNEIPAHCYANAVGKSHHGHFRRNGLGLVAPQYGGDEPQTTPTRGLHRVA